MAPSFKSMTKFNTDKAVLYYLHTCFSICVRLKAFFSSGEEQTDNTLVTVYPIDREMYAFTETPKIHKFDVKTLETLEKVDLRKHTNIIIQPAHPHVYHEKLYNCGLSITSEGSQYVIFSIPDGEDKFENVKVISKIPSKHKFSPSYMHSFGITQNYFVVIEQPLVMPAFQMKISQYTKSSFVNNFKWLENSPTFIHIVDRVTGEVKQTYETEAFFYFHTINQYEKDGHVVLDLSCYKDAELVKGLLVNHLKKIKNEKIKSNMFNSRVLRFVMPLNVTIDDTSRDKNLVTLKASNAVAFLKPDNTIFCAPELLYENALEFGTIWYEKYVGKPYKYFYGVGHDIHSERPGKLVKVDVENKMNSEWQEDNAYPSEPIFIAAPDATSEDDGVVISAIMYGDPDSNHVDLLVLDAQTFKELGRCEFKNLSNPVTKTFHGWFVEEKK